MLTGGDTSTTAPATQAADTSAATTPPADNAATSTPADSSNQATDTNGKPAGDDPGAKPQDTPKAPEVYDFKAPEGGAFDTQVIEAYSAIAKELDLPQDSAQKILDKVGPVIAARQAEQITAAQTQWAADTTTDKEIGGDKLNENLAVAKQALDKFGTPELHKFLADTKLGNHPEVIRLLYRAGKAISEDKVLTGGRNTPPTTTSKAERLYPNQSA